VRPVQLDLEPGEELRATVSVSFRGAAAATTRSTLALGSARVRRHAFESWRAAAERVGFPAPGPEMALACTDRRLLVCRTTFWLNRPAAVAGTLDLSRIAQASVVRHGLVVGCAFALTDGAIVEVEAMRAGALRRFASTVTDARASR
jgi:hypothetical protein